MAVRPGFLRLTDVDETMAGSYECRSGDVDAVVWHTTHVQVTVRGRRTATPPLAARLRNKNESFATIKQLHGLRKPPRNVFVSATARFD